MPLYATPVDSSLRLVVQTGVDPSGNPLYDSLGFGRVKPAAADQDVLDVATALAGLQAYPLVAVERSVDYRLTSA